MMDKRSFLKTSALALGGLALYSTAKAGNYTNALLKRKRKGAIELPDLPYAYDALEPHIDAETMRIHHLRHHKAYTDNFKKAVEELGLQDKTVREILAEASKYPETIRNNGGGYLNHKLFWRAMSPNGGGEPTGQLLSAINENFGTVAKFQARFSDAARSVFGSGWAWLIVKEDISLAITTTINQDNPMMDVAEERGRPLLMLDVWEHAYYLKYQNRRNDYIGAFWNVVNWEAVGTKFGNLVKKA